MNRYRLCTSIGTLTVKPLILVSKISEIKTRISFCKLVPNSLAKAQFQSEGTREVNTSKSEHEQCMDSNVRLNLICLFHCYPTPCKTSAFSSKESSKQCHNTVQDMAMMPMAAGSVKAFR